MGSLHTFRLVGCAESGDEIGADWRVSCLYARGFYIWQWQKYGIMSKWRLDLQLTVTVFVRVTL